MLILSVILVLSLDLAKALFPSSRTVYYLHTHPATWGSARDTCAKYGGQLVNVMEADKLQADVETLDTVLDWKGTFASVSSTSNLWSGLHRYTSGTADVVKWHRCHAFTTASAPNDNIYNDLTQSTDYCASIDSDLVLEPTACDTELPYICQIADGQCWFLPVEDKGFIEPPEFTTTGDLNTCAQMCRNNVTVDGHECWGFVEKGGTCRIYLDPGRHAYIRQPGVYLQDETGTTAYLKICAGGEPTAMLPLSDDHSEQPIPDNCSAVSTVDDWDEGVCYCDCDQPPVILDPEYLAFSIDEKVGKIVNELKVDPRETSSSYRKLNSAEDDRPSAQSIGAMGIAILSVVFGGLVLLDLDVLITHVSRLIGKNEDKKAEEK